MRQSPANHAVAIEIQNLPGKSAVTDQKHFLVAGLRSGLSRPTPAAMHVVMIVVIKPQMIGSHCRSLNHNADFRIAPQVAPLAARRLELLNVDSHTPAFHAAGARSTES